jgi:hypothetical protein
LQELYGTSGLAITEYPLPEVVERLRREAAGG